MRVLFDRLSYFSFSEKASVSLYTAKTNLCDARQAFKSVKLLIAPIISILKPNV